MTELKSGEVIEANPYVIQIDKFVKSLEKLSNVFLRLERKHDLFTKNEMEEMYEKVSDRVCQHCDNKETCLGEDAFHTYQMVHEIFCTIEDYGVELNTELKRKIQRRCVQAPRFVRTALEVFKGAKQNMMWNNKMAQSREGCVVQLDAFARMIQHAARELDASIFEDVRLEKKIRTKFSRLGVRLLSSVFFVTEEGKYEIHVTVKAGRGQCVATKEIVQMVSECVGRRMVLERDERPILGSEYCTVTCMEGPHFYTLQGVAKIGKGCHKISGDSFSMMELPGGQQGITLSDGMGAGEPAFQESAMVVEMLEELLNAGFPKETAIQMLNTALVMGREEVRFSTIDMSVFDLYSGRCEFIKAGASTTFVRHGDKVESIRSTSLPIGVIPKLEVEHVRRRLSDGDFVVMVTDGVLDALPVGEQESVMAEIVGRTKMNNPRETAHRILEQVLECSGEVPLDDMTVAVIGIWSLENMLPQSHKI